MSVPLVFKDYDVQSNTIMIKANDAYNTIEETLEYTIDSPTVEAPVIQKVTGMSGHVTANAILYFSWESLNTVLIDHYELQKDNGDWVSIDANAYTWIDAYNNQTHNLKVRAVGNNGKVSNVLEWIFHIEYIKPPVGCTAHTCATDSVSCKCHAASFVTCPTVTLYCSCDSAADKYKPCNCYSGKDLLL